MATIPLYKSGQGYWTRMLTAVGAATLVIAGVAWVWQQMSVMDSANRVYYQAGMALGVIAFFTALLYWLLNKPRVADFMIATEQEMKKVNWPSRWEIVGSTIVVIWGTFLVALILFASDLLFSWFFLKINILHGA